MLVYLSHLHAYLQTYCVETVNGLVINNNCINYTEYYSYLFII